MTKVGKCKKRLLLLGDAIIALQERISVTCQIVKSLLFSIKCHIFQVVHGFQLGVVSGTVNVQGNGIIGIVDNYQFLGEKMAQTVVFTKSKLAN